MNATPVVNRPSRSSRRLRAAIVPMIVLAPIALLAAACGSSSPSSPSAGGHPPPGQGRQVAMRFASCMRSHGVPNFPDSSAPDGGPKWNFDNLPGVNTSSPSFKDAYTGCKHLLPGGGPSAADQARQAQLEAQTRAGELSFAQCMRQHGVTRFPDPNNQGELTVQMVTAAGIDVHAPSVAADARACVPASHGTITPADVARATSGR